MRTIAIGKRGGSDAAHCALRFESGQLKLHRSGAGDIFVNNESVESSQSLNVGDVVRVGQPAAELHIVALEE